MEGRNTQAIRKQGVMPSALPPGAVGFSHGIGVCVPFSSTLMSDPCGQGSAGFPGAMVLSGTGTRNAVADRFRKALV